MDFFSVSQLLQIRQVAEVALVGDTFPDDVGTIRAYGVCAVDAEENIACIDEVFQEGDTQFVGSHHGEVELGVSLFRQQ